MTSKKLTKSSTNIWVTGVIAGIGEYFGWGRGRIKAMRIGFLILTFASYGGLMFVYIIASLLLSKKNDAVT